MHIPKLQFELPSAPKNIVRLGIFLSFITASVAGFGQANRSSIFGTALDPQGAVIPGVMVTVTNIDNGSVSHATTNGDGTYVVPSLLPGKYQIEAEGAGFNRQVVPSFSLLVDARSQIDFHMQIAGTNTSVMVAAESPVMDTGSSTVGQVIEEKPIKDLPLNGRDFLQLVLLSAGASPLTVTSSAGGSDIAAEHGQSLNISGGRESSNQYMVDGVFNNSVAFEGLNVQPSIDVIQEFKVQRNTFNAEFGHGTAIVNLITKAGGSNYHGTVYEFIRNNDFDAKQYFDTVKPPYHQNQFGLTVGGPLSHKTFFFFGYEGFRSTRANTEQGTLPTAAMLSGNFAGLGTIKDPVTHVPVPGNQIPSSQFSTVTQRILPFLPRPATGGATNYKAALSSKNNFDEYNIRIDHRFSDKDSLFARYTWSTPDSYTPGLIPQTGQTVTDIPVNATGQWVHVFSPTLLNTAILGFNRNLQLRVQDGYNNPHLNVLQLANTSTNPINYGLPTIVFAGYNPIGTGLTLPAIYGGNTFQYDDTITWVKGRHTLKTGIDIRNTQLPHTPSVATRGQYVFTGMFTGNPVSDFLYGYPTVAVGAGVNPTAYMSMLSDAFFVQDDYIVSRRLTLNLGLRYDRASAISDRTRGRLSVFDPVRGIIVPSSDVEKDGLINPDNTNFGPRFGFAWQPVADGKTVVRGGYGVYYDQKSFNEYNFSLGIELHFQQLVAPGKWDNLFPNGATVSPGILTDDPYARTPLVQQYSIGVQRELPQGLVAEIAFVGSNSTHLNGRSDINQAVLATNPSQTLASRRPYHAYGSIYATNDSDYANYNSLQTSLQKRASSNLFFLAAYTYSKVLDVQSSTGNVMQNAHNVNAEYGPADFNQTNRFTFSYNYLLPFGHGQRFAASSPLDHVISGWQINGIYTYSTGNPFSVAITGVDASKTGTFGGGVQRANLTSVRPLTGPRIVQQWFNKAAFMAAPSGTFGNSARNLLTGPPINNVDFSVMKTTPLMDTAHLEFRAEMFNLLNHTQFLNPVTDPSNASFDQLTSVRNAREIQFGLKINF